MRHFQSFFLALAIVVAVPAVATPAPAKADVAICVICQGIVVSAFSVAISSNAMFAVVDLAHGARGRWVPTGWAIGELVMASADLAIGISMMVGFHEPWQDDELFNGGVIFTGLGVAALTHAIFSMALGRNAPASVGASVSGDHALLTVGGMLP